MLLALPTGSIISERREQTSHPLRLGGQRCFCCLICFELGCGHFLLATATAAPLPAVAITTAHSAATLAAAAVSAAARPATAVALAAAPVALPAAALALAAAAAAAQAPLRDAD